MLLYRRKDLIIIRDFKAIPFSHGICTGTSIQDLPLLEHIPPFFNLRIEAAMKDLFSSFTTSSGVPAGLRGGKAALQRDVAVTCTN
jgi:hypothetical protein